MLLGYKEYEITGMGYQKLYKLLINENIPAQNMYEKGDILYLRLSVEYCKKVEIICRENNYEIKTIKEKGLNKAFKTLKKRLGIVLGFIAAVGLAVYFSNVTVDIRVLSDDENICRKVKQVLKDEGVDAGSYIPNIDYVVAERALRQKVDEISWAGITRKGSILFIDVVENIETPKPDKTRLPSNLIASEDAVIDKLEIIDGQVKLGVGCGVTKGDVIVSGEVVTSKSSWVDGKEVVDTKTNYTRCIGKVYGTFERNVTFSQNYESREEVDTGKEKKLSYLNIFSADIPLFGKMPDGYYKTRSETKALKLFGIETPIRFTECKLKEYDFKAVRLTQDEAKKKIEQKVYKYEQNFLKDYEIKSRKINVKSDKNGVYQTVTYTLYGVISKETEFFINK